ncbi:MAG: hypothetical protein R2865_16280 [Deinococcales bacterium]
MVARWRAWPQAGRWNGMRYAARITPELTTRDVLLLLLRSDSKALKIIDNAAFYGGGHGPNMQKIFDLRGL